MKNEQTFERLHQFVETTLRVNSHGFARLKTSYYEDSTDFIKESDDMIYYFAINYSNRYEETSFSNTVTCYMSSKTINQILDIHKAKLGMHAFPEIPTPNVSMFPEWVIDHESIYHIRGVVIEEDLINYDLAKAVCEDFAVYLEKYIYPFFKKINSIQDIHDFIINKIPDEELTRYLFGNYAISIKLIVLKLYNNRDYKEYINYIDGLYSNLIDEDSLRDGRRYRLFKSVQDYLDSGQYLEIIHK